MALPRNHDADFDPMTATYRPRLRPNYGALDALIDHVRVTRPAPDGSRFLGVLLTDDGPFAITATPQRPRPESPRDLPAEWSFLP